MYYVTQNCPEINSPDIARCLNTISANCPTLQNCWRLAQNHLIDQSINQPHHDAVQLFLKNPDQCRLPYFALIRYLKVRHYPQVLRFEP